MTTPVDAAPPKDPDEIEALLEDYADACRYGAGVSREIGASDSEYDARDRLLSAVASLRARAERAEIELRVTRTIADDWKRASDLAESSLERMRERVAGLAEALRGLLAASDDLRSAARTPYADLPFGALRLAENEARSALRSLSPSPPETKDDHR